jgi:predicted NUDIX family NTP pyrophosphohydrolase
VAGRAERPLRESCGLLLWRRAADAAPEVLLGHMGGPYWARRDDAAWSIPKGERDPGEDPLAAARREFAEEIGPVPGGEPVLLGTRAVGGGKRLTVYAQRGEFDVAAQASTTFTLEWPPRSGRVREYPEIDRAAWLGGAAARRAIVRGQVAFLDLLDAALPRLPE